MTTRESIYSKRMNKMNNIPRIALGKSDESLLRRIWEFRVTRNSGSKYQGAQCIKDK